MLRSSFLLILLSVTGCASVSSLPQSASEVDFGTTVEGKTGWSEYQGIIELAAVDENTAYEAAKAGLRSAGFTLRRGDIENLTVIGEHGMTAYDWNVVAGVYIKTIGDVTKFKTVVEGSKDIGFSGDATGTDWVGRIQGGIRNYIASAGPAARSNGPSGMASATCFVVSPDGKIITNEHVIADATRISVRLQNGQEHVARTMAQSRNTDLAILEVDANGLSYLPLSSPRSASIGMEVFTVGYPVTDILGEELKFTDGVISSLSGIGDEAAFMQITVPLQPGNSGGPLVNNAGEVVGVATSTAAVANFVRTAGTLPQNINWAAKSDYALLMFDRPPSLKPASSREEAIQRATNAACRVFVER